MKRLWRVAVSILFCLGFFSLPAYAQGGLATYVGGADAGPMVGNVAAIFWNPAALGLTKGGQFHVDVETVGGTGSYLRSPDENSAFYPQVDASVLFPIPFIGATHDFGLEKWRFGLGIYLPYGRGGDWDPTGPQRYHLIKGFEGSLYVTGTVTYKITPKIFFGVGASYVLSVLQGSVSLDLITTAEDLVAGILPDLPMESPLLEALAETGLMTGHDFAFNSGFFFQPLSTLDIGIAFHMPVKVTFSGVVDITLPDSAALGAPLLTTIGMDGSTIRADAEIKTLRPAMLTAGLAWRPEPRLELSTMGLISFSSFLDHTTTELYNTGLPYLDAPEGTSIVETGAGNSYLIKVGSKFRLNKDFQLSGYLTFIDPNISSSHVTASNIGYKLLIPTWMLHYNYLGNLFGFSLSPIFAFSRDVHDSVFDPRAPAASGIGQARANGLYKGFAIQAGLSYTRGF